MPSRKASTNVQEAARPPPETHPISGCVLLGVWPTEERGAAAATQQRRVINSRRFMALPRGMPFVWYHPPCRDTIADVYEVANATSSEVWQVSPDVRSSRTGTLPRAL